MRRVADEYDYVFIDCPPTLGVLVTNAVYAADEVLIPLTYSKYALDGVSDLFATIEAVKRNQPFRFKILRNAYDSRTGRSNEFVEENLAPYRDHLFGTIIRKSESVNQAQMAGVPVAVYDARSHGAQDYAALTEEILKDAKTRVQTEQAPHQG